MYCNCPLREQPTPSLASICSSSQLIWLMMMIDDFLQQNCDIADLCNRFQQRTTFNSCYDFVVIGSGSGGATVAGRLADSNFSVLLLEAGLEEPAVNQVPAFHLMLAGTELDWKYTTYPEGTACLNQEGQRCYLPRGKVLGGSSAINYMVYLRGSKKDFDNWAQLGNPGWSYDEVLPFFLRSEDNQQIDKMDGNYHSTKGPLSVSYFSSQPAISNAIFKAGRELGYSKVDLNGRTHTGFSITQGTIKNGHRMSAARAFLRPLRHRRNLHVMLDSIATKIIFDTNKRATGVEFYYNGGLYQVGASKEVILSGGTINSPQILMNSGIGPDKYLTEIGIPSIHHLPGVGENLQDHVAISSEISINETEKTIYNLNAAKEYVRSETGPFSTTDLIQMMAMINTKYANRSEDNPDIQLLFGGYEATCDKISIHEKITSKRRSIRILSALIRPKSRGFIRLRDNNPLSKPLIFPRYFTNSDDVKTLIEGVKFVVKLIGTKAMKIYDAVLNKTPAKGCENFLFGTDPYWKCAMKRDTVTIYHPVGTCKMGPSTDPLAVVDNELRVYGVKGLRVIDASIMPQVVSANTNAATIMIGEKGAEFIRLTYGG